MIFQNEALFFIICGNQELYNLREQIYNFKEKCIEPEILESGICTSSKQLIKLAFNLYNSYPMESVMDTFSGLDEYNFELAMHAIRLRFDKVHLDAEDLEGSSEYNEEDDDISDYLV